MVYVITTAVLCLNKNWSTFSSDMECFFYDNGFLKICIVIKMCSNLEQNVTEVAFKSDKFQ